MKNSEWINLTSTPTKPDRQNTAFEEAREMLRCRWVLGNLQPEIERDVPFLPRVKKVSSNTSGG